MAIPAYSKLLWASGFITSLIVSPAVPAGYIWDVRDIYVVTGGQRYCNIGGFTFTDNESRYLWAVRDQDVQGNTAYHWEGRQILNSGDVLFCDPPASGLTFRLCGYQLSSGP